MYKLIFITFIFFSFNSIALPYGGYWSPDFKRSVCLLWQTSTVEIPPGLTVTISSNFSYKGKGYELSELQKSYGFKKERHVLEFILPEVYNSSYVKVDYPLELYVNGEKLTKVQVKDTQYFYLTGKAVSAILARAENGHGFDAKLKSISGEIHTVKFNNEQLSLSTKMHFTCSENIT